MLHFRSYSCDDHPYSHLHILTFTLALASPPPYPHLHLHLHHHPYPYTGTSIPTPILTPTFNPSPSITPPTYQVVTTHLPHTRSQTRIHSHFSGPHPYPYQHPYASLHSYSLPYLPSTLTPTLTRAHPHPVQAASVCWNLYLSVFAHEHRAHPATPSAQTADPPRSAVRVRRGSTEIRPHP